MTADAPYNTLRTMRLRGAVFGAEWIRYGCGCGYDTGAWMLGAGEGEDQAAKLMREHLADYHGAELNAGRCARCGLPTNYFRAVPPAGDPLMLCERCAPAIPTGGG